MKNYLVILVAGFSAGCFTPVKHHAPLEHKQVVQMDPAKRLPAIDGTTIVTIPSNPKNNKPNEIKRSYGPISVSESLTTEKSVNIVLTGLMGLLIFVLWVFILFKLFPSKKQKRK